MDPSGRRRGVGGRCWRIALGILRTDPLSWPRYRRARCTLL